MMRREKMKQNDKEQDKPGSWKSLFTVSPEEYAKRSQFEKYLWGNAPEPGSDPFIAIIYGAGAIAALALAFWADSCSMNRNEDMVRAHLSPRAVALNLTDADENSMLNRNTGTLKIGDLEFTLRHKDVDADGKYESIMYQMDPNNEGKTIDQFLIEKDSAGIRFRRYEVKKYFTPGKKYADSTKIVYK
ncbi:hypothetical protein J4227_07825 [Candidatus Woesearchaeota archaeon]|nr:hypothetical protein [Candidatus Woesearchaeota archaeon]